MAQITLKEYQEDAIVDLRNKVNKLLQKDGSRICQFKSPTGSGKTLMIAEWMMRFCDPLTRNDNKKFAFIWLAVHKLHDQSHDSLKKYYSNEGFGLKCSYFSDLEDKQIQQNEQIAMHLYKRIYPKWMTRNCAVSALQINNDRPEENSMEL